MVSRGGLAADRAWIATGPAGIGEVMIAARDGNRDGKCKGRALLLCKNFSNLVSFTRLGLDATLTAGVVRLHASKKFIMGPHIDEFCGEICLRLVDIDEELRHLKITIREKAQHAEPEIRSRLEKVMKRIAWNQPKVAAARAQVEDWIKANDALRFRNEEIPEDRIRKLTRAAQANRYAAACIDLAIAAVDQAERSALEAWLMRQDANSSQRNSIDKRIGARHSEAAV